MTAVRDDVPLEDRAAEVIRLGREVHRLAKELSLGGTAQENGFVGRALARLELRAPFDPRDDQSLLAVQETLRRDLEGEVLGREERLVEIGHDEDGPLCELRQAPVYSDRGRRLIDLERLLAGFLERRADVLDRAAAHREVLALLAEV